jgi:hypothetical protein
MSQGVIFTFTAVRTTYTCIAVLQLLTPSGLRLLNPQSNRLSEVYLVKLCIPTQTKDMCKDKMAYKAFWTCRGTFGKTWGLKPKVIYCIYTVAVRPMVTYAATIWRPGVKLKTSQAELSKLQKDVLLGNNRSNENSSNSCDGSAYTQGTSESSSTSV